MTSEPNRVPRGVHLGKIGLAVWRGQVNALKAFVAVAGISAISSLLIVVFALQILTQITDGGMWAIAAMAFAPSVAGIGVSYFISRLPGPPSPAGPAQPSAADGGA